MPNWCQNEVSVYAEDRGKAEAFVSFVRDMNTDNYFSFNRILPMPDELRGTRSPTMIASQEECAKWTEVGSPFDGGKPITQEMSDRFKKEYGHDNWYDWTIDKWGTKWDADCPEVDIDDFGEVKYMFDTAWGPPKEIYDALRELFPNIEICWFYRDDANHISGWL